MDKQKKEAETPKTKGKAGIIFDYIKEMRKTPRGKSILFFCFYFLFFAVVILLLSAGGNTVNRNHTMNNQNNNRNQTGFSFDNILNGYYYFTFTYNLNNHIIVFDGRTNRRRAEFTKTSKDTVTHFERNNNRYFVLINEESTEVVNPFYYSELLNVDLIKEMINEAEQISRTEYAEGNTRYRYQLSRALLVYLMDGMEIGQEDSYIIIELVVDEEREVNQIILNLTLLDVSSYADDEHGYLQAIIHLKYRNFGEVDFTETEELLPYEEEVYDE